MSRPHKSGNPKGDSKRETDLTRRGLWSVHSRNGGSSKTSLWWESHSGWDCEININVRRGRGGIVRIRGNGRDGNKSYRELVESRMT